MKKIFSGILVSLLLLQVSFTSAIAALIANPVNAPSQLPRDKYQTDLFSGSAGYEYPIKVPKGTNDLTPNVTLSYNSSSAREFVHNTGMGWDLNRDYIERDVNFTPGDTGDDKFKIRFQGAHHDLVYVSSESRYHTKKESNLHITKQTVGETNDYNEYWQVITKDGTKYRFGKDVNSEQVCNGRSYVWRWNLDQVEDIHGNKIFYTYSESNGASFLTKIEYNTEKARVIDFTYASNPYSRQVYIQGCSVNEASRLSDIQVKADSNLVNSFDFNYDTASNSGQLLKSITEKGSDGASLPATRFDYKPEVKSWNITQERWINDQPVDANLEMSDVRLMDLNADTLPDIVQSRISGSVANWRVLLNTGNAWETSWNTWSSFDQSISLQETNLRLVDVTGDSMPDIVKAANASNWNVWRGTGSGWSSTSENWANLNSVHSEIYLSTNRITMSDVNGDNLTDIIRSWVTGGVQQWEVFINTGSSWNTTPAVWSYNGISVGVDATNVNIIDVNGDGLNDLVQTQNSGTNATWYVFKNTGTSWSTSPETWVGNANIDAYLGKTDTTLSDVNGDGLPDIVKSFEHDASYNAWKVLLNQGNSWSTTYETWVDDQNIDTDVTGSIVRLADATGDGIPDIVKGEVVPGGSAPNNRWSVFRNNNKSPHLLQTIYTPQGGTIKFDYKQSSSYDNTGADSLSDLPFNMWVVEKMTAKNGMTGAHETTDLTTYSYLNGYYKWQDKEFRGFETVDETLPNTAKKKYVFNQDDAKKGLLSEVQSRASNNDPYLETEYTWSNTQSNGIYTVNLTQQKDYTYDGTASDPKIIQNDYEYDSYGNITKKSEKGDTSISTDDRFIYNDYVYNTSSWIVDTVKNIHKKASDDSTKVSESWFYYDGNAGLSDTPTKGDLTKEVKWLDTVGGTNPVTQYAYDTYGNQTSITDANNRTTATAFDASTYTYPVSITNAKNHVESFSYDLGTGNLLSKTDPNGFTTSYEYDDFGRITKEILPYDSSSFPTTSYGYFLDGIAPEGTLVSKREISSGSGTLDTFTFQDGLERKVQTRTEAEDTTKQRVIDTYYDPTGEIKKVTIPYLATSTMATPSATPTPPPATKFGDGSDGNITISSNTTEAPIDSSVTATAGNTSAAVSSGIGFAVNQIVLFHQTQGTNAGQWEFARVKSYSGTTLKLTTALTNSYSSSGSNKAQVRVVPQYHDVTVNSGVTWTAKSWNGTTGGMLAFLADGTVTVSGTISATDKGFRGAANTFASNQTGLQGEGTVGLSTTRSNSTNGNGAGGGSHGATTGTGGGGGGGGHTATGSSGTNGNVSGTTGGVGGSSAGTTDLTTMVFGGGGAQGGSGQNSNDNGGSGGNGGGLIFITGASINVTGSVVTNGIAGENKGSDGGAGGGGAGGAILVKTTSATLGSSLLVSTSGSGGTHGGDSHGVGGTGASGRIRIQYETSLTGSTTPTASTSQAQISLLPAGVAPTSLSTSTYATPDQNAKYTEWTYDPVERVSIIRNPKGVNKTVAYDHWKETTIDENGHIKREYKNAFEKIVKVDEVKGGLSYSTTYSYTPHDDLSGISDASSNLTSFVYDSLRRKKSQTDPDMGTWEYKYDGVGNETEQKDNRNITVTKTYDELNRITLANYPTDVDFTYTYDGNSKKGTLTTVVDKAGTVNYSYDNRLRRTQEQRTINGTTKTTQFSYDASDRIVTQTNPDNEVVTYAFNPQGTINSVTGSSAIVSNIDYNALGKITKKDYANSLTTNYTYNTNDFRLNRIQTGSLQDLNYTYDEVGNITRIVDSVASKTKYYNYDDFDRLTSASESAGFNYQYSYDPIGNLTSFTDSVTGAVTDYQYGEGTAGAHALTSSVDNVASATATLSDNWASGSINSSRWDNWAGAQASVVSQELRMNSTQSSGYYGVDSEVSGKVYSLAGSFVMNKLVNAGNQSIPSWEVYPVVVWKSGAFNNQLLFMVSNNTLYARKYVSGTGTTIYSAAFNSTNHKYFKIRENNGTTYFDTSADGQTWTNFTSIANPFVLTNVAVGQQIGTWQWEASTTSATFDNFNMGPIPFTSSISDDWSSGSINASKWNNYSSAQNSVVSSQLTITSTTWSGYYGLNSGTSSATLDLTGSHVTNHLVNAGNQAITSLEVYPVVIVKANATNNQLYFMVSNNTVYARKQVSGTNTTLQSATFNPSTHKYFRIRENAGTIYFDTSVNGKTWGNFTSTSNPFAITSVTVGIQQGTWQSEGSTSTAIFDNFNILPQQTPTYTYDANGNMTSDGANCYQYNEANQMDKVKNCSNNQTIAEYVYDYNGMRMVKKNFTGGTYSSAVISWSDSFETKEIVGGSTENTAYYWVNGELVAKKKPDGSKLYYQSDHLRSTSVITNQSGTLVEQTKYDPWGEVLAGGTQSKFLYTGQEKDSETDLHYYNARYYNSDIRRFTQPDDIMQDVYDPQTLNRYSYVRNNPLRYTDPSGHSWIDVLKSAMKWPIIGPIISKVPGVQQYMKWVESTGTTKAPPSKPTLPNITQQSNQVTTKTSGGSGAAQAQQTTLKGTQNPVVKEAVKKGQEMHKAYKQDQVLDGVRIKEYNKINGIRPDFVDLENKIIYELKPNNPQAIKQGNQQLEKYKSVFEDTYGGQWKTVLDTY